MSAEDDLCTAILRIFASCGRSTNERETARQNVEAKCRWKLISNGINSTVVLNRILTRYKAKSYVKRVYS